MKNLSKIIASSLMFGLSSTYGFAQSDTTVAFKVYGNCEMCKERIEASFKKPDVLSANWNVNSKMVEIKYNKEKLTVDQLHKWVAAVGHDTEKAKATAKVYSNLPGCCQYDRPSK